MKISFSFLLCIMIATLLCTHSYLSLAAILAAALHELGHILMAKLCSIPIKELKLGIFGAALTPEGSLCSYKKEILLALAGPAINFILGATLLPFSKNGSEFFSFFTVSSFFLGFLNLMPIYDLDGGRILNCLLCQILSPVCAERICRFLSFCIITTLWLLSVYLLLRFSASLSLFVFSAALFCKIFIQRKN